MFKRFLSAAVLLPNTLATPTLYISMIALSAGAVQAQDADPQVTLFTNVSVFDGINSDLIKNANVVVTGNKITSVSTEPLAVAGGRVIDGEGPTLMPGLTGIGKALGAAK